ncbi:MAG: Trk system potassium transporter TrkA [Christensenellaceae bacterium]|nr:Trk system potassium transporter TrkA [Christensenellaceae bacterium]
MHIVIVGDGKVGYMLAEQLCIEGHDIAVIDNRSTSLTNSENSQDVICIEGNGASHKVQIEAGVPRADLLIAVTNADEVNMLCCMVAKKLGAKHTIARVRDPEYQEQMVFLKEELGLSLTINPEYAAASEISRMLRFSSAAKAESFAKGRVEVVEFNVREGGLLPGLALHDMYRQLHVRVLVCAVQRQDEVFIPDGSCVLQAGDKISIVAAPHDINAFFKAAGADPRRIKNVMIVGGGRISYYLANMLVDSGMHVKIIEQSEARCHLLSEWLPKASILHGDGTDQDLLHEEGLQGTDAFIALTGIDEENIILSMYANSCKVEKVITKVNNARFIDMLGNSGLESFISPKQITSHRILSYVRAMQNATGSNVETLYRLVDDTVEALEFHVREDARCIGVPLKDLKLKPQFLLGAIIRKGKCIIPGGGDSLELGDSVVVVTTQRGLRDLNSILKDA